MRLTKRSSLMRNYVNRRFTDGQAPSHIWFGVSIEDRSPLPRYQALAGNPGGNTLRML